jgi:hypothetical protein
MRGKRSLRVETLEKREMFCLNCAVDIWINHGMPNDFVDTSLPPMVEESLQASVAGRAQEVGGATVVSARVTLRNMQGSIGSTGRQ